MWNEERDGIVWEEQAVDRQQEDHIYVLFHYSRFSFSIRHEAGRTVGLVGTFGTKYNSIIWKKSNN